MLPPLSCCRAHYELFIRALDAPNVSKEAVCLVHPTCGPTQVRREEGWKDGGPREGGTEGGGSEEVGRRGEGRGERGVGGRSVTSPPPLPHRVKHGATWLLR